MTQEEFELLLATLMQAEPRLTFTAEMYVSGAVLAGAAYANVKTSPDATTTIAAIKLTTVGALADGKRVLVSMANSRAYIVGPIP